MTQNEIDNAIIDGKENAMYLTLAMIDDMASDNQPRASQRAIEAVAQYGMISVLDFWNIVGSDSGLSSNNLSNAIDIVHEADYAQLLNINDFVYQAGTGAGAIGAVVVVYGGSVALPSQRSYTWTVISGGQTVFTMPFNVSTVDANGISVTLNSVLNPQLNVDYT